WSKFPTADQEWVVDRIITSTDEFSDMNGSCDGTSLVGMLGSGRLNINKALTSGIYPSLSIQNVNYQNDSDGDGVFNPGEQVKVKLVIANGDGWADAENIIATLTTDDSRITILDSTITFDNPISAGNSSFTLIDHFLLSSLSNAHLGNIPCTVHIQAGASEPYYEIDFDIAVSLSLNQYGFPLAGVSIKSSPLIADLDNNSYGEIYFGSEDDNMYGYMYSGTPVTGFPFETGDKIQSSPAAGDVDGDGNNEIVFGSYDGKLYILSTNGNQELAYSQSGFIIGAPALGDFDGDTDLEIVFTTQSGTSGKLYAIHHTGENMDGFPIDLDEKMVVGPALGDLEGDGLLDIVVTTYEDNIYAINSDGSIKSGFPYVASHRFKSPATLVDLDGDNDLEIVAGNDDGNLYILHHDGTVMTTYDVGNDIRGGISVADINDDGSNELLFVGYDDKIHIWNPTTESELDGWPYDMGTNALSCPLTADLDNDGDLEIVTAMKSGTIYIFHHDGSFFNNFPYTVAGNIETTPAIGKLDDDNDFEIVFGTTSGLQVIDIKSPSGERSSWKLHRGNMMRTGLYNVTLTSVQPKDQIVPDKFFVSQNYPNPFNPSTTIEIQLAETNNLIVSIFDVTGRLINTLINNKLEAGLYSVEWNGKDQNGRLLPTGVYIMKVVSGKNSHNQKIAFVK
ncbi:MAG: T9SS type A sorting domain-containing protein, partial [Candidatus Marinimicrobia bacterium]|nr:T9SS type A sorting domain-containing protein [Candidatus Neomarinimicrobiota bacterium]